MPSGIEAGDAMSGAGLNRAGVEAQAGQCELAGPIN
jgi:hypothetical protein